MITTRYNINTSLDYNLKLAIIADLHDQDGSCVVSSLNADKPDVIAIVGDLVDRASLGLIESTKRFLQCCLKIAPTIYSFGNHERGLLESEIEEIKHIGVTILDNAWTSH